MHFNISWSEAKCLTMAEIGELLRIVDERENQRKQEERRGSARERGMTPVMN